MSLSIQEKTKLTAKFTGVSKSKVLKAAGN